MSNDEIVRLKQSQKALLKRFNRQRKEVQNVFTTLIITMLMGYAALGVLIILIQ